MDEDAEGERACSLGQVPGAQKVDACIVAAADAMEGEAGLREFFLDGVFVVCAYVDGAGFWEADARGVGEEGWEAVVVLG